MGVHTLEDLQQFQALPLNLKIRLTQTRIRTWVNEFGSDGVYVSFSGGKDSTVLLDIVRKMYPEIEAVFCDTGLEYPEIREFVKTFDNVTWLKPKMSFFQVCEKYGFPLISKEVSECVYGARKYLTSVIESASLDRQTDRQTDIRIDNSTKRLADLVAMQKQTRGGKTENIENSVALESLISNARVQKLLGILPAQRGLSTMESIPNEADRSAFSCVRYQFFLDAPFEISHKCCSVMKKEPFARYGKETRKVPITAQMAAESRLRTQTWKSTDATHSMPRNKYPIPCPFGQNKMCFCISWRTTYQSALFMVTSSKQMKSKGNWI